MQLWNSSKQKLVICFPHYNMEIIWAEQVRVAQGHLTIALAQSMEVSQKKVLITDVIDTDVLISFYHEIFDCFEDGCVVTYERPGLIADDDDTILQRLAR